MAKQKDSRAKILKMKTSMILVNLKHFETSGRVKTVNMIKIISLVLSRTSLKEIRTETKSIEGKMYF